MDESGFCGPPVGLNELVLAGLVSLAQLDVSKLEELTFSCRDLRREITPPSHDCPALKADACNASKTLQVFASVLEATRENLRVLSQVRDGNAARTGYLAGYRGISSQETDYGND